MSHATATKTAAKSAAKKPAKKKVSAFSTRKVDPAYYWMVVPAAIIFAFFLYLPFLDGVKYSFTNSQGYGDYKFVGLKNYIALFQDNRVGHAYLFTFLIAILITVLINVIGPVPVGAAELEDRLQEWLPSHLLHPLHPLRAGHRLRVQVHLHEPAARTRQGAGHQVAVHLAADQ